MYFITHSGIKIDMLNISVDDIYLDDIAHHLTKICRYGGSLPLNMHYSVASHSMNLCVYGMSRYPIEVVKNLLLHDATEAYLGDIVTGLKIHLPDYKKIENRLDSIIKDRFNLRHNVSIETIVSELDKRIILDEILCLIPDKLEAFVRQNQDLRPLSITVIPDVDLCKVKTQFLKLCNLFGVH